VPEYLIRVREGPEAAPGDDHPGEERPRPRAAAIPDIQQCHRDLVVVLVGLGAARAGAKVVGGSAGDGLDAVPASPVARSVKKDLNYPERPGLSRRQHWRARATEGTSSSVTTRVLDRPGPTEAFAAKLRRRVRSQEWQAIRVATGDHQALGTLRTHRPLLSQPSRPGRLGTAGEGSGARSSLR